MFFKIVDIDKQVKYIPVYNNKYIFDKAEISINAKELSYISGINNTFQASESSPEIMIFTDKNEITDINLKANQLFNNIGIGSAKYNNGVLVYVNTNPSPKIRIEVGYGLEDVINDAKAGRIIDNNMAKVSNKPLAEYSNDELRKLLPLIFKDITTIVADKYKIDISKKVVRSNSEKMKYKNIITIRYGIKNVEPYVIYLFITTAILLFITIIISKFCEPVKKSL